MMSQLDQPLVSIGLPVYNGEDYLETALTSLLAQTYKNIEIIVCDNASTDATREIVEKYCESDNRIKYIRHNQNLGAAKNYNSTFELSKGKYFKWAAHDDVVHNSYIEKCVAEMEKDESISLVQPLTGQIDGDGKITSHQYTKNSDVIPNEISMSSQYQTLIQKRGAWVRIFGLMRSSILVNTPLIANYVGSDLTLLGEFGLNGKVRDIDSVMFWRREHGNTSTRGNYQTRRKRLVWFDSSKNPKVTLPEWRLSTELIRSVNRQNISFANKLKCYWVVFGRMWIKKRLLGEDLIFATLDVFNMAKNRPEPESKSR